MALAYSSSGPRGGAAQTLYSENTWPDTQRWPAPQCSSTLHQTHTRTGSAITYRRQQLAGGGGRALACRSGVCHAVAAHHVPGMASLAMLAHETAYMSPIAIKPARCSSPLACLCAAPYRAGRTAQRRDVRGLYKSVSQSGCSPMHACMPHLQKQSPASAQPGYSGALSRRSMRSNSGGVKRRAGS